ncbi:hypothetical protein [Janibacter melonis]|uniref:hypothetical protein n=1 Tax=Janibacter melonis TaxID=262209 RepID=UPI0019195DF2|nr:hypothetical protein [Janibacter melonis]MCB5991621.1 hypothetical protein [Janibacter melonis]
MRVRERRVSWSMLALVASLAGAALLGAIGWVPSLIGKDSGVQAVTPGMLTIADGVGGVITLGEGRAVALDQSGLRITDGDDVLYRTVRGGSPVSALRGTLDDSGDSPREDVEDAVSDLRIDRVGVSPGIARYTGTLSSDGRSLPTVITVTFDDRWVRLYVDVQGADAVVLHGAEELGSLGYPPALPDRLLRGRAWWVEPGIGRATPVMTSDRRTDQALGPEGVARAVDLRRRGHTDLHAWGSVLDLSVTSSARPEPEPEEES